jgi:DNA processing protein
MKEEALYYNAIAAGSRGSYSAIKKIKAGHVFWKDAFEAALYYGAAIPNPEEESEVLLRAGIQVVLSSDPQFPPLLREMSHPPFAIYIKGGASLHGAATIGIVGTRRASPEGKQIARQFAATLARSGMAIASGLAFGIDAAAHEGCLDANGYTIAVFAGGLGSIYPRSNRMLAEKIIAAGGALISEYPIHESPFAYRFIERNRIVSGLSRGVVVMEAPQDSGALATARFAFEQNRDVFVIPGNIRDRNYQGSNSLIQQGAMLVASPDDILENYGIDKGTEVTPRAGGSVEELLILETLKIISQPVDVDKIAAMTKLEPRIINKALSFLLLNDSIKEVEGGYTL